MGFKVKSFYVIGGDSNFPIGDTDALRRTRSEFILTKLSQALISCNVGWQLDTTRNATDTSYIDIPSRSNSKTYPALFFTNSISGCKLFMAYFGDEVQYNGIKNFSGSDLVLYKGYDYHGGVCCSIIPEGSSSVFGDPTTTTFIPSDATRICGTFYNYTFSSSYMYSAAYNPTSGYLYPYCICATPYAVAPYSTYRSDVTAPSVMPSSQLIYVTGRIFGYVAHPLTNLNAKYGTYIIREGTNPYESYAWVMSSELSVFGETIKVPARSNGFSPYGNYPSASVSREDGTWILGSDSSSYNVIAMCNNVEQLSSKVFSRESNTKTRWIPIYIVYCSSNISSTGITNGDGVKGIIDTDLFRCGISTVRTGSFADGSFVDLENQNLLTGLDASEYMNPFT